MEAVRGGRRVHVWSVTGGVVFRPKSMVMTPPATDRPWPSPPPRSVTIAPGRAHGPISMIQASHKPVHREYLEQRSLRGLAHHVRFSTKTDPSGHRPPMAAIAATERHHRSRPSPWTNIDDTRLT